MHQSLSRVIAAVGAMSPADDWRAAGEFLSDERERIERYLAQQGAGPVYGFTTRLGQEDSLPMAARAQEEILHGHLIGPATPAPADWRRVLVASKVEQCSHGGSGIHPLVYQSLLDALTRHDPIQGNWLNSYSSGDVVAGAWLVDDIRRQSPSVLDHPGDLITLINGNFVSTSLAIVATGSLVGAAAALLAAWLPAVGRGYGASGEPPAVQLPISLRDATPAQAAIFDTIAAIGAAMEHRLSGPSCNPRFTTLDQGITARSQSSFLDFTLTLAMSNGIQVANLLGGLWQRVIQHRCDGGAPALKRIQAPKTAQGLLERMHSGSHTSRAFSGFDSEGVEDLRDLSLIHAHTLLEQCLMLAEFEAIWGELGSIPEDRSSDSFHAHLVGILLGASDAAAPTEARTLRRIAAMAPALS